jgi:hypothetical protein
MPSENHLSLLTVRVAPPPHLRQVVGIEVALRGRIITQIWGRKETAKTGSHSFRSSFFCAYLLRRGGSDRR